ncbi:MAG: hypothetical protein Q9166_004189 [cf. Caloplaca sp. 2 TL-2023]
MSALAATYDQERRQHAPQIIRISGSYLRFVCQSEMPVTEFEHGVEPLGTAGAVEYAPGKDLEFLGEFFGRNGRFILGVDTPYPSSLISPSVGIKEERCPIGPRNGVRAPNPRLCFSHNSTGYLYDALTGADIVHVVVFASDLQGPVRAALTEVSRALDNPGAFFQKYGGAIRFNLVLVSKCLPKEAEQSLGSPDLMGVKQNAKVLYDNRAPDEDAHGVYDINHAKGAMVVVRPDLWVGFSVFLDDYFGNWLVAVAQMEGNASNKGTESNEHTNGHTNGNTNDIVNGTPVVKANRVAITNDNSQ